MRFKRVALLRCGAICALLLVVALIGVQCGRGAVPTEAPSTILAFQTLAKGSDSAITEPRRIVLRTEADWRTLWSEHTAGRIPSPPLPEVSFETHIVIAIFRGKTEGGFPITITKMEKRPTELMVLYEELSPPPGFPLGVAVMRQPYHVVRVEWLSLPVRFQKRPQP